MDLIIPQSAIELKDLASFTVIGDGGKRKILEELLKKHKIKNVKIINPVDREKLISYYNEADVLFLHLNNQLVLILQYR